MRRREMPRILGAPVLRPARSSKVLLVKNFQTQCSGHLVSDSWVSAILWALVSPS